jgi:hypothetical protein
MKSQRDPALILPGISSGPVVFIASYWNSSSSTTVSVYSNCDQVRLYLNGSLIGTGNPVAGTNLEQPRFSFNVPSFLTGNLRAEGLIGGTVRAADTVFTPGSANRIRVVIDTAGLEFVADGSDIAIVYASILDANGQVIPTAAHGVTFTLSGPGTLVGTNPVAAIAGIASILLRAPTTGTIGPSKPAGAAPPCARFAITRSGTRLSVRVPSITKSGALFTLCNAQGKVVGRWNVTEIVTQVSVPSLPHGVYFGQITGGAERFVCMMAW